MTTRARKSAGAPMRRYAAFLRGVSPTNARMPELKRCFERAGFTEVRTLLSSGNVVFGAPAASEVAIQRRAEAAMEDGLGRTFLTSCARPTRSGPSSTPIPTRPSGYPRARSG